MRIIFYSLILFLGLSSVWRYFFGGFFNKRFHCVISAHKALFRASGMLHPVHFRLWSLGPKAKALGRVYVWLHLRHGVTVQVRGAPETAALGSYLRRLES